MNATKSRKIGAMTFMAVAVLMAALFAPVLVDDGADAANPATTINIQPGQTWSWTPTFTSGLSPTVTVSASDSAMPADTATFSSTSGNASVSNGKVTVSIPSNYAKSAYYVKVKATTSQPTQNVYYEITFSVASFSLSYSADSVVAKVGSAITNLTPTVTGATATSYAISGTLPSGLSFNTSTGVISGTPTAYKAQTDYTITATLNTVPVQTVTKTVSIGAFTNISASNYTVYAIKGQTAISVPGVSMPTGTVLQSCTATVKEGSGTATSVTFGTASNGLTVTASTGAIAGTPSKAGTFTFSETYTATAATGGSSATRTVTVVVEDKVAISGNSSFNSFVNHSDSVSLTKSAGPSGVAWTITAIKKGGSSYTNPSSNGFTVSNGTVTCGTAIPAGTYVVTVKLATTNSTSTTSGATGANASSNSVTKDITVTVAPAISINNASALNFYMAENKVYDSLTLGSNISGATFTVTAYGTGIASGNISVATNGAVAPGSTALTAGSYTVTVKAVDPNNAENTASATLNVHVAKTLAYTNAPSIGVIGE